MKKLEGHEPGEFENREDVLKQNYLTAADRIKIQQEEKIKARLSSLTAAQQDITGSGAGAAGHGVELETWIFQTQVQTDGNSAHINDHLCRLDPYRFYRPGGAEVTNYHYNYLLYQHVHTGVVRCSPIPMVPKTGHREHWKNYMISKAGSFVMLAEIEEFVAQVRKNIGFASKDEILEAIDEFIKLKKKRISSHSLVDPVTKSPPPHDFGGRLAEKRCDNFTLPARYQHRGSRYRQNFSHAEGAEGYLDSFFETSYNTRRRQEDSEQYAWSMYKQAFELHQFRMTLHAWSDDQRRTELEAEKLEASAASPGQAKLCGTSAPSQLPWLMVGR